MNITTRRFPRTCEQAFGRYDWPIAGPYRRGSQAVRNVLIGAAVVMAAVSLLGFGAALAVS